MKLREGLEVDDDRLAEVCGRYHVRELSLFGSALRADFGPDSDVDLLYVIDPPIGFFAMARLRAELETLMGRQVDLVSKKYLHWYIRDRVLAEARPVYAA